MVYVTYMKTYEKIEKHNKTAIHVLGVIQKWCFFGWGLKGNPPLE